MYMQAMELVRLGDASVEAFEQMTELFRAAMVVMMPHDSKRDGLGLEDRPAQANIENWEIWLGEDTRCREANDKQGQSAVQARSCRTNQVTKRIRFCTICKCSGHKRTTCPQRGDMPKQPRKHGKCMNCVVPGHRKNTCGKQRAE